jgi:plasmid maintenance system antidote protein VapI
MKLLDHLIATHNLKNDRELADSLDISTPVISRIRNGHTKVSSEMIIRIHEIFGMPIAEIKSLCNTQSQSAQ